MSDQESKAAFSKSANRISADEHMRDQNALDSYILSFNRVFYDLLGVPSHVPNNLTDVVNYVFGIERPAPEMTEELSKPGGKDHKELFSVVANIVMNDDAGYEQTFSAREIAEIRQKNVDALPWLPVDKFYSAVNTFLGYTLQPVVTKALKPMVQEHYRSLGDSHSERIANKLANRFEEMASGLKIAAVDGLSPDEYKAGLVQIAQERGEADMSPQFIENADKALKALGVEINAQTRMGMGHLINAATGVEHNLTRFDVVEPAAAPDPIKF